MNMKEYYDKCIRKEDEGRCLHCGKETKFYGYYKGYAKFCCLKHQQKSEYIRNKISKSFENRNVDKENEKRKQTCLKKYGKDNIAKVEKFQNKWKETNLEKYGEEHTLGLDKCKKRRVRSLKSNKKEINEKRKSFWRNLNEEELSIIIGKRKETFKEKYGVEWISQSDIHKELTRKTNEERGRWIEGNRSSDYWKYWNEVRNETIKHRIRLFRLWDGNDYYTGEKLVTNEDYKIKYPNAHLCSNSLQPTVDHKISVKYGFLNNINPKEIGSFKNLCICSRTTNSTKRCKIEKEFGSKNEFENKHEIIE